MSDSLSADAQAIRTLIDKFIAQRCEAKLEKLSPEDEKYHQVVAQFERETWIADAARRVSQLQVVTHVLKGIHPDAKGTNLFVSPDQLPPTAALGYHACTSNIADVTGNAAALDIYKFLKIEYANASLLARFSRSCPDAIAALSDTPPLASEWAMAFASITEAKGTPSSHVCAKQLYWLKGDDAARNDDYVLLAPLFPSSLIHEAFEKIQHDRFSDEAKEARKARRDGKPANTEVHTYPEFATRKLGGTKPQNISQLNSERGGSNILLSSLPPHWDASRLSPVLNTATAMHRLRSEPEFYRPLNQLRKFLQADPSANMHTRDRVRRLVADTVSGVIAFTMKMHDLPAGWTATVETQPDGSVLRCELPDHEQHWLDPFRAAHDAAFQQQRALSSWQSKLKKSIASEINRALNQGKASIGVGDTEHREWTRSANHHPLMQALIAIDAEYMEALDRELTNAVMLLDDDEEYPA